MYYILNYKDAHGNIDNSSKLYQFRHLKTCSENIFTYKPEPDLKGFSELTEAKFNILQKKRTSVTKFKERNMPFHNESQCKQ